MTANQINYFKERETQRRNVVSEQQRAQEIAIAKQNADTNAYNAATNAAAVAENARHNREMEILTGQNYASMAEERTGTLTEATRHNVVAETETQRHNESAESLTLHTTSQNNRTSILTSLINTVGGLLRFASQAG